MKRIYFVTEGSTDQVVIEGLIESWLGEEFIVRQIQPPSSAYAEDLDSNLSEGWKGVLAWCAGKRADGCAGRDEALRQADCLVIHTDADVATDPAFLTPPFNAPCPPASQAADWVRQNLTTALGGALPANVVLCVPAQDLEAWVLTALHPKIADEYAPIECRLETGALLIQLKHRLVRRKMGRLKKDVSKYRTALNEIVAGWPNCTEDDEPRCPEAVRFEAEARQVLGA